MEKNYVFTKERKVLYDWLNLITEFAVLLPLQVHHTDVFQQPFSFELFEAAIATEITRLLRRERQFLASNSLRVPGHW